jgi:threonine/homoserine/homoserine lactone efflux protein
MTRPDSATSGALPAGQGERLVAASRRSERPMTILTLLAFAFVAVAVIATPGPTVLLALTNGSRFGVRRACAGMTGAVMSDFILVGAAALGLGALLAASEFWFTVVKWIGVGYLAFLASCCCVPRARSVND